jgi:transcription factor E
MRISDKNVDTVIKEVAGEDVIPLVRELKNKKNVSEFALAENIDKEINETRNMLYRLYHSNLVSFTRKKDKKKGWYVYYWTFNTKSVRHLMLNLKVKRLKFLSERLFKEQQSSFFECESCSMRVDFNRGMDFGFKCPECSTVLVECDNENRIKQIEVEIKKLTQELK